MRACGIIVVSVLGIPLIVVIILAYIFHVNVPGISGKNLWDWLQLLIIPVVLAVGGFWLNQIQKDREEKAAEERTAIERLIAEEHAEIELNITLGNHRETALQGYLDKMSELLLHEKLRNSDQYTEVRSIARALTLTVFPRLDGWRKRYMLQFLYESALIDKDKNIIYLHGADLRGADLRVTLLSRAELSGTMMREADLKLADLSRANLKRALLGETRLDEASLNSADLSGADLHKSSLREVDLSEADLTEADLSEADLTEANLTGANLTKAILISADLTGAKVATEQLDKASSLKGAIMPDGIIHD